MKELAAVFFPFLYTKMHPVVIGLMILFYLYLLAHVYLVGSAIYEAGKRKGTENALAHIRSALTWQEWTDLCGKVNRMERERGEEITL